MITSNDIATLLDPQLRDYIAGHLSDDPGRVALSLREHGALIATQIKYSTTRARQTPLVLRCTVHPAAALLRAKQQRRNGFRQTIFGRHLPGSDLRVWASMPFT